MGNDQNGGKPELVPTAHGNGRATRAKTKIERRREHRWTGARAVERRRPPPLGDIELGARHVDVWRIDLDAPQMGFTALHHLLSLDERERALRFHRALDRDRFIAARGSLRLLLSRYQGIPPAEIVFEYGENGKPHLPRRSSPLPLHFNLAHSGRLGLIAATRLGSVGVDLERVRPISDLGRLTRHLLTHRERCWFSGLPRIQRQRGFSNIWVRKEAYLKATGEGLSRSPATVEVSVPPERPVRVLEVRGAPDEARRWSLSPLDPAPGYVGAVAVKRTAEALVPSVRFHV